MENHSHISIQTLYVVYIFISSLTRNHESWMDKEKIGRPHVSSGRESDFVECDTFSFSALTFG